MSNLSWRDRGPDPSPPDVGGLPPVCDYEGSDYQRRFWDDGSRRYEDLAEATALRRLLPETGRVLLELGAGAGRHSNRYAGFDHVVLVDYSMTQLQEARSRLAPRDRFTFVAANVYRLPFASGAFDAATMIRVLHHLSDPALALREAQRALSPGAVFVLEYANKRNLKAVLRYALRQQRTSPFDQEAVEVAPLMFNFHPRSIDHLLADAGFTAEQQLAVSYFRLGLLKRLLPTSVLVKLDSVTQVALGGLGLSPSIFLRTRASGPRAQPSDASFFACPSCRTPNLTREAAALRCQGCDAKWAIEDEIFDLRVPG